MKTKLTILAVAGAIALMVAHVMAQETVAPSDDLLVGKWTIQIGGYTDTWIFQKDGTMASAKEPKLKGTWKQETNCILIQWEETDRGFKTWEALTLPLNKDNSQGGNWNGQKVTAKKQ